VTDRETIYHLYNCLQDRNIDGMLSCYHPNVVFHDPVFGELKRERLFYMWRMLLSRMGSNAKIEIQNVYALNKKATCSWSADYEYGRSKKKIHNEINSNFKFEGNRIISQSDSFDLYKWSKQANGLVGFLFGWTPTMQNMIVKQSNQFLDYYISKHPETPK
jgi:hypothetical protein